MILRFLYGTGFWVLGKNEFQNMLIRLDGNLDSEYISDLMKSEFIRVLKTVKYNKPCDKKELSWLCVLWFRLVSLGLCFNHVC